MARATKQRRPPKPVASTATGEGIGATTALRLAVTKGGLGLEIGRSVALGPFEVDELSVALVGLTFPVDLSGGVTRFRHRRGVLEHLTLRVNGERARAAIAPRLRGILDERTPALTIAPTDGGIVVGLTSGSAALAFDLYWAPSGQDVRWIIGNARSIGLQRPALAAAAHAVDAMLGRFGQRSGVVATIAQAPRLIAREVLPALGARTPDTQHVVWGPLEADAAGWRIACDGSFAPPLMAKHVITELELARLTAASDDVLAAGDLDQARQGYASLLERAPRDTELARRIADVDRSVGGRAYAALATVVDFMPVVEAGPLGAELLALTGNSSEAIRVFEQIADREAYAPLAALGLFAAAQLSEKTKERARLLEAAVARAPALAAPRWHRMELRLRLGDVAGALADAEYLEAAARGTHARHNVWARAAEAFLASGQAAKAVTLFERALRYIPDDPRSIAGLARGLLAAGRAGRALDLLARAVELSERRQMSAHDVTLLLARALVDTAGDLAHAVARVRSIPAGEPESIEARALEGRWRGALGDVAGASIAFAGMRDTIEASEVNDKKAAVGFLLEAAQFEREHDDLSLAQRHLALAVQLSGRDPRVRRQFREVTLAIAERGHPEEEPRGVAHRAKVDKAAVTADRAQQPAEGQAEKAAEHQDDPTGHEQRAPMLEERLRDEQRAQVLGERLRADPTDDETIIELCGVLQRLGRDMDLFAVLSARLEDAVGETRERLVPLQRSVLERLRHEAERQGRSEEAQLYADALITEGFAAPRP